MYRDQAKAILPLIQAYADGCVIETQICDGSWREMRHPKFDSDPALYRIKPQKPEYRLFQYQDKYMQYNGLVTVATRYVGQGDASAWALSSYERRIENKEGRWLTNWLPLNLKD